MRGNPTFSIIVPVYNVEKYLRDCIESVLNQSCKDYELILVDDGSPDNSGEIADEYAKKSDLIKVIHKTNGGVVSARKAGVEASLGEYIVNIDGDDYIAENALEILTRYIDKTHSDIYCFGFFKHYDDGYEIEMPKVAFGVYDSEKKRCEIYKKIIYDKRSPFYTFGMCPSVWSRIVKKELYKKWQMQADEKIIIGEDMLITVPIMYNAESISIIDEKLYHYRVIADSVSHRFKKRTIPNTCDIIRSFSQQDIFKTKEYNLKNQLGAYCVDILFNHLFMFAKQCNSYKEFIEYINSFDKIIFEFLRYYNQRFTPLKTAVVTFLVKHRCWFALWRICKRRR